MTVYGVVAREWESDYRCMCATDEIAKRMQKEIGEEYGLDTDKVEEFVKIDEFDVIGVD